MNPRVGVIGLGYVGLATAACLLERGIRVDGYELSAAKRKMLRRGDCPIGEPGVQSALRRGLKNGLFQIHPSLRGGKNFPEVLFVCVNTPGSADGSADLGSVNRVMRRVAVLAARRGFKTEIVLKSTVPPGTLEELNRRHPALFRRHPVAFHPEFMREGMAMDDFLHPPQTVIGVQPSGSRPEKLLRLLQGLGLQRVEVVDAVSAESLKWACNAFHALKVCFANEIGRFVTACGGDAGEVMRLFCRDRVLNISRRYLRPGAPFGGSCLRKDFRALVAKGERLGIKMPVIESSETSNESHLDYILEKVARLRPRTVAILGMAFKKNTDDVRGSPSSELVRGLARAIGCRIQTHDFLVRPTEATDRASRGQMRAATPGVSKPGVDLDRTLAGADLVIVMHDDPRYRRALAGRRLPVFDVAAWNGFRR